MTRFKCISRACLGFVLSGAFCQIRAEPPENRAQPPSGCESTWKLLIDDHWIASKSGVRRVLHQPEKATQNPLIRGDDAWAPNPYCYGTAMYDQATSRFKLWYMSYNPGLPLDERHADSLRHQHRRHRMGSPASGPGGVSWINQNNIVMTNYGHHDLYSPSIVRDDRDSVPERRYKMIWWDFPKGEQGYRDDGMCVAFSPDGIRWTRHPDNPVLPAKKQERSISDVMSVMYDSRAEKFVAYTKGWADPWPAFRQIVRTESSDFIHWSEPEVVLRHAFDEQDPQSYGMAVSQYEGLYLGLLCSYKKPGNETIDIQLTVSHDNKTWSRVADQATFLPTGPEGSWDDGMIFCDSADDARGPSSDLLRRVGRTPQRHRLHAARWHRPGHASQGRIRFFGRRTDRRTCDHAVADRFHRAVNDQRRSAWRINPR